MSARECVSACVSVRECVREVREYVSARECERGEAAGGGDGELGSL